MRGRNSVTKSIFCEKKKVKFALKFLTFFSEIFCCFTPTESTLIRKRIVMCTTNESET